MGSWASGRKGGIRNYPYSRNLTTNLDTYKSLDKGGYWGVHAIGEVWAEMLFEMAENLIDDHGFHPTLFPPAVNSTDSTGYYSEKHLKESKRKVPAHGNTLAVQLVVDAMKLQPCRPSFQNARDAILTADKVLTGGENRCTIWKSFAKRGLGPEAKVIGSTPWVSLFKLLSSAMDHRHRHTRSLAFYYRVEESVLKTFPFLPTARRSSSNRRFKLSRSTASLSLIQFDASIYLSIYLLSRSFLHRSLFFSRLSATSRVSLVHLYLVDLFCLRCSCFLSLCTYTPHYPERHLVCSLVFVFLLDCRTLNRFISHIGSLDCLAF